MMDRVESLGLSLEGNVFSTRALGHFFSILIRRKFNHELARVSKFRSVVIDILLAALLPAQ